MSDLDAALRHEFEAKPGSFLLALRTELIWSKPAFWRLVGLMENYIEQEQGRSAPEPEHLVRWVAEGFWYVDRFVREWTTDANFPRAYPTDYYERAFIRLNDLAFWYFTGVSPYQSTSLPVFKD